MLARAREHLMCGMYIVQGWDDQGGEGGVPDVQGAEEHEPADKDGDREPEAWLHKGCELKLAHNAVVKQREELQEILCRGRDCSGLLVHLSSFKTVQILLESFDMLLIYDARWLTISITLLKFCSI